ncbi:MAG: hypothetical protein JNL21_03555 [Myxococcales bacterium]|nr:hypothetical protein [Myxococcales bacterium]
MRPSEPAAPQTTAVATNPAPLPAPTVLPSQASPPLQPGQASSATPDPTASTKPDVVASDARKELEKQRAALVKACFEPGAKKVKITLNFTFGADGKQITRGVTEDRETGRDGAGRCVSDKLDPIAVPPPGANTYVEIPWELP